MEYITFILFFISLILVIYSQLKINYTYRKYRKIENKKQIAGWEVARKILDANGMKNIYVIETKGNLTDHYDPTRKVVKLSTDIYKGTSIASASVAAHECGHAIQDKEGYSFMQLRSKMVPICNLSSKLGYVALLIGAIFGYLKLAVVGLIFEIIVLAFHLVTLPVEFDASKRGKEQLEKLSLINSSEKKGVSKVLGAAAFTYVASFLANLLEIIRLAIQIFASSRRD